MESQVFTKKISDFFPRSFLGYYFLRLFRPNHANSLFKQINNNRSFLRAWLPWVDDMKTASDSSTFIQKTLNDYCQAKALNVGIWHNKQIIGVISFRIIDWKNETAALGYWLAEKFNGKGIMQSACHSMLRLGFEKFSLKYIEIHCAVGNKKSCKLAERLGLHRDKDIIKDAELLYGLSVDHFVYNISQSEFFIYTS